MLTRPLSVLCLFTLSSMSVGCYASRLRDRDAAVPDAAVSRDMSHVPPRFDGGSPVDTTYFKPDNTGAGDGFGWSVSATARGDTLFVGAPFEDGSGTGFFRGLTDDGASDSGAVYGFFRAGGSASQGYYAKASNTGIGDHFGWAVSLVDTDYGKYLAVGAPGEASAARGVDGEQADDSAPSSGAVYLFAFPTDAVERQQAYVKASNSSGASGAVVGDEFGCSVALSADGTRLAVGARYESSRATGVGGDQANDAAPQSGAVYVFARTGSTWTQEAYIKASNTAPGQLFGSAVALSADGTTLIVGAPGEDSRATGVDGDGYARGAPESGAVYVYTRAGGVWAQDAYVKASNTGPGDAFGSALSLSTDGGSFVVGAPFEDSDATGTDGDQASERAPDAGAVYEFARSSSGWAQITYLKASNTGAGDEFGSAVSIGAPDPQRLAVGAPGESSAAVGVDGDELNNGAPRSGAVYLFARVGSVWVRASYFKAVDNGVDDRLGTSLSLSDEWAPNVVAGAPFQDAATMYVDGLLGGETAPESGAVFGFRNTAGL